MSRTSALDTIKNNKAPSIADFPQQLRKLAEYIKENYEFKSISEACQSMGINYLSVQSQISRFRKKGFEYNELLYSMLDTRNKHRLLFIDNKVYETALDGNMTASKLFYQRANAIDNGSGGDRNVIINQINIPIATATAAPIDLIKTWQERDKEIER